MSFEIKMLTLGIVQTNCYIIGDNDTGEAIVIDPVDNADLLLETLKQSQWELKMILATHGHFDHVLASKPLKDVTNAPFLINERDQFLLDELPEKGLQFTGKRWPEAASPDRYLTDESETIKVGGIKLETIFTPGHSPGHISFFMPNEQLLFSGDCVFQGSIGRTDLTGGNFDTLMNSIVEKLLPLGDEVQILPGHMGITTIGQERLTNPFITSHIR